MKPDEKVVIKNLRKLLKETPSRLSFYMGSKKVKVGKLESIQIHQLTEGDFVDSNYQAFGTMNIEILLKTEDGYEYSLTEPKKFQLFIKVENDNIVSVKDDRIDITNFI